jgi:hypothetical protein
MYEFIYTDSLKRILSFVDKTRKKADGKMVQTIARIDTVTECDLSSLQNGMGILEINDPKGEFYIIIDNDPIHELAKI